MIKRGTSIRLHKMHSSVLDLLSPVTQSEQLFEIILDLNFGLITKLFVLKKTSKSILKLQKSVLNLVECFSKNFRITKRIIN